MISIILNQTYFSCWQIKDLQEKLHDEFGSVKTIKIISLFFWYEIDKAIGH
jgi:hypothetical protein